MRRCLCDWKHVLLALLIALAHQQAATLHMQYGHKEKRCSRTGVLMARALREGIMCVQL